MVTPIGGLKQLLGASGWLPWIHRERRHPQNVLGAVLSVERHCFWLRCKQPGGEVEDPSGRAV